MTRTMLYTSDKEFALRYPHDAIYKPEIKKKEIKKKVKNEKMCLMCGSIIKYSFSGKGLYLNTMCHKCTCMLLNQNKQ